MPFSRRHLVRGALLAISLIMTATMLRLAFEWGQAVANINAMIVTPAAISLPTSESLQPPISSDGYTSAPEPPAAAAPAAAPVEPAVEPPPLSAPTLNILLMGTDARPEDSEPTRTDSLILVRIERDSGRVSMLSMPRDLWVSYPGIGEGRINAAYTVGEKRFGPGGGAALAKSTVTELLGIRVDNFVLINFQGFRTLIDVLDGIKIDVPQALYDPQYPTEDYGTMEVRFAAGSQLMDGERSLIYARTRHADSDFGRIQRQQLVLMAIFNRIRERGLLQQLTSFDDYTGAMRDYVKTDLSRSRMLELAGFARGISPDNVLRYAIDAEVIVDLRDPATFGAEPTALKRIVHQFTGQAISSAGGQ